jgi:serine phosphatase RsbU (regulator of sigma subunit)
LRNFSHQMRSEMSQDKKQKKDRTKNWRRFYQLYKTDLTLEEIERLIKRDVPGLYDFYGKSMEKPDRKRNPLLRAFTFARNFFLAFLMKLSGARRLFYSVAFFLFFYGLWTSRNGLIFLSFVILNILLALEVADKIMAKDELEVARDIQMSLMPKSAPVKFPYDVACFSEPAKEVGGDYYDFLQPPQDSSKTYVVIGDVKGKGMAAALYMVRVQALLQYLAIKFNSPAQILIALNRNIRKIIRNDYFISMAITSIDREGRFCFSRAGHMPFVHYRASTGKCVAIQPRGIAVGLENGVHFEKEIEETCIIPERHDVIIFYTDGIVEMMNQDLQCYDEKKLHSIIEKNAGKSAAEIKNAILRDVTQFRGTMPPNDDLTLIVIKIFPS